MYSQKGVLAGFQVRALSIRSEMNARSDALHRAETAPYPRNHYLSVDLFAHLAYIFEPAGNFLIVSDLLR